MNSELNNKEYRSAYVTAHVRNGIPFQIRAMRNARGWDQKDLANKLGNIKLQPVVSRYENPDYGRFSVSTLLDLAAAFDVALVVRFAPFREVVAWESSISEKTLNVPSFDEEIRQAMPTCAQASTSYVHVEIKITGNSNPTTWFYSSPAESSVTPFAAYGTNLYQPIGGFEFWKHMEAPLR